jgi:hypothetical protein
MKAGDAVIATTGPRAGQRGKLVEPVGCETSWVKWVGAAATTYPHRSLKKD